MSREQIVTFEGEVLHETEKAWRFRAKELAEPVWLPKSQCQWDAGSDTMSVPEWLCIDKELI